MSNKHGQVRVTRGKGWIKLRCPGMFQSTDDELCRRFAETVLSVKEVRSVEIDPRRSVVAITYVASCCTSHELLARLARAFRSAQAAPGSTRLELGPTNGHPIRVLSNGKTVVVRGVWGRAGLLTGGLSRLIYLILGGVAFALSIVGLIVPGIPTVPFLLLSSYCLVRARPSLNDRLLRSRVFGSLIRNWQEHRALATRDKMNLVLFSAVIISATIVFAEPTMATLLSVAVISSIMMYIVLRTPTVPRQREDRPEDMGELPAMPAGLPA